MKYSKIQLSEQQRNIVEHNMGNAVVSASAGTGKTRTMIAKILFDMQGNNTHKVIAAITFTIKAAQEIRERLGENTDSFIGTNNSFAIEEVIKPFMKDVYGEDFNIDIDTDYQNKDFKIDDLNDGIEKLKKIQTIYSYKNNKKNFVFDLALNIVKESDACKRYLKSKYFNIYVDEYQDCDNDMHDFFMYLSDVIGITTFVVGDEKQSIYRWRGANPESFKSIFAKNNFTHLELTENHRSDKQIQDFSNIIFSKTRELINTPENNGSILWIKPSNNDWIDITLKTLDKSKSTALLRSQKYNSSNGKEGAKEGADLFTENGFKMLFVPPTPIDDITTNSAWFYFSVASFVLLDKYSVYSFYNDIPTEINDDKKMIPKLVGLLNRVKEVANRQDCNLFNAKVKELASYIGCIVTDECIAKTYETVKSPEYIASLNPEKPLCCSLTIHSAKGLEFDQVIVFAEDFSYNGKVSDEHLNNLYVSATRAMSKLIIINTEHRDSNSVAEKLISFFKESNINSKDLISVLQ